MQISTRLNSGFFAIILLLVGIIGIASVGLNKAEEGIRLAANEQLPAVLLLTHLEDNYREIERIGSRLALIGQAEDVAAQIKSVEHLKAKNAVILDGVARSIRSSQANTLIQSIRQEEQQLHQDILVLLALRQAARSQDQTPAIKTLAKALAEHSVKLLAATRAAIEFLGDSVQIYAHQAQNSIDRSKTYMWVIGAGSVLLALLMAWFISRSVSRPLFQLQSVFAQVEHSGDLRLRSDNQSGDEVGQVARGFNQMMDKQQANEERITQLLAQTDQQAARLQAQRDELEKSLEEVFRQSESLRANEAVLRDKNEEVVLANADLMQARDTAEAASRTKSQFLANMSHELRTPMNAILGMLQLLQKTDLTQRQLDYASKTESAAKSLLGLLNDILDLSKIDSGKMEIDPHPFRLDHLLRDLSLIYSMGVSDKPVEVLFDIAPATPAALVGDALRLKQILINLGGNAVKFTPQGTVVLQIRVVGQTETSTTLHFAMIDTGIGIAVEQHQRIFDGFSQAEASTTRRFGGTGLGLNISRQLVALMGGELMLDSVPGQGSTFHFTLTFSNADQFEADSRSKLRCQESLLQTPLQVLVVDDNRLACDIMAAMFASWGWQAVLAHSGAEAIAIVQSRRQAGLAAFDAIFIDWLMPEMDGWQVQARLQSLSPRSASNPGPLNFMITAHGRDMLQQRSADEQGWLDGYLVKPLTASILFDAVSDARAARSGAPIQPSPSSTHQGRLIGMRILLVEDNLINQQVAQELLSAEGAQVVVAGNGQLGVNAVAEARPMYDVVLMDIQMPVMDGFTATRKIRAELGLTDLPIIAMTANAMKADREDCLAAGMNAHVGKPFDLTQLVDLLQSHCQRPLGITVQAPSPLKLASERDLATK